MISRIKWFAKKISGCSFENYSNQKFIGEIREIIITSIPAI